MKKAAPLLGVGAAENANYRDSGEGLRGGDGRFHGRNHHRIHGGIERSGEGGVTGGVGGNGGGEGIELSIRGAGLANEHNRGVDSGGEFGLGGSGVGDGLGEVFEGGHDLSVLVLLLVMQRVKFSGDGDERGDQGTEHEGKHGRRGQAWLWGISLGGFEEFEQGIAHDFAVIEEGTILGSARGFEVRLADEFGALG